MSNDDNLLCVFSAELVKRDGTAMLKVPQQELDQGPLSPGEAYRVALLPGAGDSSSDPPTQAGRSEAATSQASPVDEGETIEVEIEDIGEQGDGLARIGPGYVVFVPETELGDRVTIEITDVRDNFAFADVVEGPY